MKKRKREGKEDGTKQEVHMHVRGVKREKEKDNEEGGLRKERKANGMNKGTWKEGEKGRGGRIKEGKEGKGNKKRNLEGGGRGEKEELGEEGDQAVPCI